MSAAPADRRRWFGTDGIRAPFGQPPLDEATVRALGLALGARLGSGSETAAGQATAVLGGDTRASTPILCRWLTAGLERHGVRVCFVGTLPTPGIAFLARHFGAGVGIAVSASHNPYQDNGIKLIGGDGFKWSPEAEATLETAMAEILGQDRRGVACHALGGDHDRRSPPIDHDAVTTYLDSLAASLPTDQPLAGLHMVIDAANGAASAFAEGLFARLGARVTLIHAAPDGNNINRDCGSTHPGTLAAAVQAAAADLGVAFDGDADRAIFADETGTVRDGDAALYLWSRALAAAGRLRGQAIVATSMSNLGLEVALRRHGIGLVRCDVGDRAVVQTLVERGMVLGGEQSGHLVDLDLATTGDGMLTAVQIAAIVAAAPATASAQLAGFTRFPQLIENVRVGAKPDLASLDAVQAARREVESALDGEGRLVLRYSGTEPLARIMLEGPERPTLERLARHLAAAIRAEIGV